MGSVRLATYPDIEALPEHVTGEIIDGVLYTQPLPPNVHVVASSALGNILFAPFWCRPQAPGSEGWIVLRKPELHLRGNVLVPDLAGWRRQRLPEVPNRQGLELAPDWVCEILSPSTAAKDRAKKLPIYSKEGVHHTWLVDPAAKTLEVFQREGAGWLLLGTWADEATVAAEPFAAVAFELGLLWRA
ncbi:MAG: Uma2 family endonuclease [Deltaproteobacteria bacterium]|nr:Uma2 family endonuclease [Deltaproteobacteria bacterium]